MYGKDVRNLNPQNFEPCQMLNSTEKWFKLPIAYNMEELKIIYHSLYCSETNIFMWPAKYTPKSSGSSSNSFEVEMIIFLSQGE